MSVFIRIFVFVLYYTILVRADNSMPIPYELSIADDPAGLCRQPTEKITSSNISLCFGSLEEATPNLLYWRAMFMSVTLDNKTIVLELKVRRVVIFAPGASFQMAGGKPVSVFSISRDLQLNSNFNGYGMAWGPASINDSVIFKGQLNSTVFEGQIIYQNMSRSHTFQCFHNNTLQPDFYRDDSCVECLVSTFNTHHNPSQPIGWRSFSRPICKDNQTSSVSQRDRDIRQNQTHPTQSTPYYRSEVKENSGFPKTGFSDYKRDLSHALKRLQDAMDSTDADPWISGNKIPLRAKPREDDVKHEELEDRAIYPKTGQGEESEKRVNSPVLPLDHVSRNKFVEGRTVRESHNHKKKSVSEQTYSSILGIGQRNRRNKAPTNDNMNTNENNVDVSEEKLLTDQITNQVLAYRRRKRSLKNLPFSDTSDQSEQISGVRQSEGTAKLNRAQTSTRSRTNFHKRSRSSNSRRSDGSQLHVQTPLPNLKPSKVTRNTSQKSSRKARSKFSKAAHSGPRKSWRKRRSANESLSGSSDKLMETVSCSLHLVADHLFFSEMGERSASKTVKLMLSVIVGADAVFRTTDFDGDGVRDNIGFVVKNITIIHNASMAFYGYSRTTRSSFQYLRSFSKGDFSDVCLGVAFTAIDFERGVVGLAWYASSMTGDPGKGGICGQRIYLANEGSSFSFNTAIVTFLNHGNSVSMEKAILTMAHEFGHCFGSSHDDMAGSECNKVYQHGSYLMQKYRPSQYLPNNYKFSPCSLRQMYPVIALKGGCLTRYKGPTCGNGVLEEGEECDCGLSEACRFNDPCCSPGDTPASSADPPCGIRRSLGLQCSPVTQACCSDACKPIPRSQRYVCRETSDCYGQASCDGHSPVCPPSPLHPDGTPCHAGVRVCIKGRCRQSMCVRAGLLDCFCRERAQDRCKLCCRRDHDSRCLPATVFNITTTAGGAIYLPEGDGCLNYGGVCSIASDDERKTYCVMVGTVDFSALLEPLPKSTSKSVSGWLYNAWVYVLFIPLVLILAAAAFFGGPRLWRNLQGWSGEENTNHPDRALLHLITVAQSRSDGNLRKADKASAVFDRFCSRLELQQQQQRPWQRQDSWHAGGSPSRALRDNRKVAMDGCTGSYSPTTTTAVPASRHCQSRLGSPWNARSPRRHRQYGGDVETTRSTLPQRGQRPRAGRSSVPEYHTRFSLLNDLPEHICQGHKAIDKRSFGRRLKTVYPKPRHRTLLVGQRIPPRRQTSAFVCTRRIPTDRTGHSVMAEHGESCLGHESSSCLGHQDVVSYGRFQDALPPRSQNDRTNWTHCVLTSVSSDLESSSSELQSYPSGLRLECRSRRHAAAVKRNGL